MSEKLSLQWHDFRDHTADAFGKLLKDKNFTDVTLAFGDGNQLEAHKVVLAASSPFFQNLLGRNAHHPHPVIFMRRVESENLEAILDFLYRGEANILQENLEPFLLLAEELQMKGFMESTGESRPLTERNLLLPMRPKSQTEKLGITKFTSASNESMAGLTSYTRQKMTAVGSSSSSSSLLSQSIKFMTVTSYCYSFAFITTLSFTLYILHIK